jgi:glycosyltransferase involved in cell wall biosynthesis
MARGLSKALPGLLSKTLGKTKINNGGKIMNYTVVIAERNEPDLDNTVENIKKTQKHANVFVVNDKSGKGPGFCRHAGINHVEEDIVIIVDAHMRFPEGALDKMAEYIAANPTHVACAKCHHNAEMTFDDSPYCGARICWKSQERNQYWSISGKWREVSSTGLIGCVMGACYGFNRQRYLEVMGAPWQVFKGWGMDEESLSIINWLCGGENVLLDIEVAHMHRVQSQLPYKLTSQQACGVWANRLALLEMLPMSSKDRIEQTKWLQQNDIFVNSPGAITKLVDLKVCHEIRAKLEKQERTFDQWKERWIEIEEGKEISITEIKRRLKKCNVPFPSRADKSELMALLTESGPGIATTTTTASASIDEATKIAQASADMEPKQQGPRANWGAKERPRQCPKCKSTSSSVKGTRTYHGPERKVRYRACDDCPQRFSTVEVLEC